MLGTFTIVNPVYLSPKKTFSFEISKPPFLAAALPRVETYGPRVFIFLALIMLA